MPGLSTNGLPTFGPSLVNGVPQLAPQGQFQHLSGRELIATDTQFASGFSPQTAAVSSFNIASLAAAMVSNTGTLTTGAVTLNTAEGIVNTGSITTAAGASSTFSLVNSLISATAPLVQMDAQMGTCTAGVPTITGLVQTAGTLTGTLSNLGTAAFNGTIVMPFKV